MKIRKIAILRRSGVTPFSLLASSRTLHDAIAWSRGNGSKGAISSPKTLSNSAASGSRKNWIAIYIVFSDTMQDFHQCISAMGINPQWPKEWKEEGDEFVEANVRCKSIFIDGQILLMKSHIKDTDTTWREFVRRNFSQVISRHHTSADTVIMSFDNYDNVPIFKSIEQNRRISASHSVYQFKNGDQLPNCPPSQEVWVRALQNRVFKSNIISIIATILTSEYVPPRKATTLIIDFVNCVRIDYKTTGQQRVVMPEMNAMGESDVKFMRYIEMFHDLCIDSIDSDVVLIALLYKTRHPAAGKVYVRRYKTKTKTQETEMRLKKRRKLDGDNGPKEYEVLDIGILKDILHASMRQAIGVSHVVCEQQFSSILVFMTLLCGCDYSRKLPRIGVRSVWENMHVIVPALLKCTQYDTTTSFFSVDVEQCINTMMVEIYSQVFRKHVKCTEACMVAVLTDLKNSSLSDKLKTEMPTYFSLDSTIRNIQWVINYWNLENTDPQCDPTGSNGFVIDSKHRVVFADKASSPP